MGNEQFRINIKSLAKPANHREAKFTLAAEDLADAAGSSKHRYHVCTDKTADPLDKSERLATSPDGVALIRFH